MAGNYVIEARGVTIGSVMKFAGEPSKTKWVAYARRKKLSDPELKEKFPTMRAAVEWLETEADKNGYSFEPL